MFNKHTRIAIVVMILCGAFILRGLGIISFSLEGWIGIAFWTAVVAVVMYILTGNDITYDKH